MDKGKFFRRLARIVGCSLVIATIFHSTVGAAELTNAIKFGDIRSSVTSTLKSVWVYSSVMLLLSAIWIFFLSADLGRFDRKAWWQAIVLGLGYFAGSIGAMVWAGAEGYLIAFALIGLVLLIPLLARARAFKTRAQN